MTLQVLIDTITQKQLELCCERSMTAITCTHSNSFFQAIKSQYKTLLLQEKNYYSRFLEIASGISNASPHIPIASPPVDSTAGIREDLTIKILSFENFIEKLLGPNGSKMDINYNNKMFQDFLSFSLFPSISSFFTFNIFPDLNSKDVSQEHNFNNVFLYLNQKIAEAQDENLKLIYRRTFDLLMRPLFASPYFITFSMNFFQPIFRGLKTKKTETDLAALFNEYFTLYSHLIPPFIAIDLLLSDDPVRTLWTSFFEIALASPETAQYYGLFHFSTLPDFEILSAIKYDLSKKDFEGNSILDNFLDNLQIYRANLLSNQTIDNTSSGFNRLSLLLKQKDLYFESDVIVPENSYSFRHVLLNTIDRSLLKYILSNTTTQWNECDNELNRKSLHWVYFYFSEFSDAVDPDDENSSELHADNFQTMNHNPYDPITILRHLLQRADPLPHFLKTPELSLHDFLNTYLVERGSIETLPMRKRYFEQLENSLGFKRLNSFQPIGFLLERLSRVVIDHVDQIEKYSIATQTKDIISNITSRHQSITDDVITLVDNLVMLHDPSSSGKLEQLEYLPNESYIRDPPRFAKMFFDNLKKNLFGHQQIIFMEMIDRSIISQTRFFLFQKIEEIRTPFYDAYMKQSPWNTLDGLFSSFVYTENILSLFLNHCFPDNHKARNNFLRNKLLQMSKYRNDIRYLFIETFQETSILRIIHIFMKAYSELMDYIKDGYNVSEFELGPDDYNGILAYVIATSFPQHIASTSAMFYQFFQLLNKELFDEQLLVFQTHLGATLMEIKVLIRENPELRNQFSQLLDEIMKFENEVILNH